ncbi:uncharacterized protein LOC141616190 [Silene latifolia]|uniref:uncharacterized protein LOC141616146 n=1 Tax=Silene latifolia TaxID=37657 RepID=UPI003D780639
MGSNSSRSKSMGSNPQKKKSMESNSSSSKRTRETEEEEHEKKKNPYEIFKKKLSELFPGYYWDDQHFCMVPDNLNKNLPRADCDLSLGYYPGIYEYMYMMEEVETKDPPSSTVRVKLLLHALFEIGKKVRGVHIDTRDFRLDEETEQKLKEYAPKINPKRGFLYPGKIPKLAESEMLRHLPSIPFLNIHSYWQNAISAYEKYEMGGFIDFIMDEGEKRHLFVDDADHHGWSMMRFTSFVRLAHVYPPIKSSGGQLSFRIFRSNTGYFLREILLALTRKMEPAARSRSLVIYEDLLADVSADDDAARYVTLIPFDALLRFKKKNND